MPHIYREDLEKIENLILNELKPREYKIETNEYEYEKVEQLQKDLGTAVDLHVQTYTPYLSIDFNKNSARVYSGDDDLKTMGAFDQIFSILSKKERRVLYYLSKVSVWVAPILFFAPIRALAEIDKVDNPKLWVVLGVVLVSALWWVIGFYSSLYKFSIIDFTYLKEKPNFIVRNKDQIILVVIGAIIGAIATIVFNKILF